MLKDDIKRREEILKKIKKEDSGEPIKQELRGEVEIKAWKNGQLFYHDGGNNTVTLWAKHSLMRLLSGDSFSSMGTSGSSPILYTQPSPIPAHHTSIGSVKNEDGTILSGGQYFWDYADYTEHHANRTSVGTDATAEPPTPQYASGGTGRIYPFFPTKMLFGTGFEFSSFAEATSNGFASYLVSKGYDVNGANFDANISHAENCISSKYLTNTMIKTRTVNDKVSTQLADNELEYADNYGLEGAIKNCLAKTKDGTAVEDPSGSNILDVNGNTQLSYNGVGRPAFIYCNRSDHWFTTETAEVLVKTDSSNHDNRIVFSVILPEQVDLNAGFFYPYNGCYNETLNSYDGMMLKQAGLFCDARLTIGDKIPGTGEGAEEQYQFMPGGIMIAKRKISPVTKTPEVRISVSWSLFL